MGKIQWKGTTLLSPLPVVLVTSCRPGEAPDIATVAWCGITCSKPPKLYISLRPSRYTYEIVSETREFVVNLVTSGLVRTADSCGVYTGRKVDKFAKFGLTAEPSFTVACPSLADSPISLECKVTDIIPQGSHDMFLADIVSVSVAEELMDESGALKLGKAGLVAYSHGDYMNLGKRAGTFGFSVKKTQKKQAETETEK